MIFTKYCLALSSGLYTHINERKLPGFKLTLSKKL